MNAICFGWRSWAQRCWPFALGVPLLLWPALLNGYPIVFSDTGTYLSQAIHRYAGWDRPVFYSLFMYALHLKLTTWPVVVAQAGIALWVLDRTRAVFFPAVPRGWMAVVILVLAAATGLPWTAARLMPDLFTGPLVLALAILVLAPERLGRMERWLMCAVTLGMILVHQSHVPLLLVLLAVLVPLRRRLGARAPLGRAGRLRLLALPMVSLLALSGMNWAAHGRFSPSPFGGVFLLARVIEDGPGLRTLQRECPESGWRLCAHLDSFPISAADFLWRADSPLQHLGGAKTMAEESVAIVLAALRAEPWAQSWAILDNTLRQLRRFGPGDGLHAWEHTVSPWIARDFPGFEQRAYEAGRQERGELALPGWTETADAVAALLGLALLGYLLWREGARPPPRVGLVVAVLLGLLANAAITGGISGPHERYQSRVIWLPAAVGLLALPGVAGRAWRWRAAMARREPAPQWRERPHAFG